MKFNIIQSIFIILLSINSLNAQTYYGKKDFGKIEFVKDSILNISMDRDCLMYNSATISKAMIGALGEDSVKRILNAKINITFVCDVDSLGYIKKLERIWSKQEISDNFIISMENYLVSNRIRFYICYSQDPPNITKTCIIKLEREHFKNSKVKIISFGFPGELMNLYEYEKEKAKAKKKGICLSKYDYLLIQISRFL